MSALSRYNPSEAWASTVREILEEIVPRPERRNVDYRTATSSAADHEGKPLLEVDGLGLERGYVGCYVTSAHRVVDPITVRVLDRAGNELGSVRVHKGEKQMAFIEVENEGAVEAIVVEAAGPEVAGLRPGCRIDFRPVDRTQDS